MPYLQKLNDQIFALDKRVHKVQASQKRHHLTYLLLQFGRRDVLRLSSDGDAGGSVHHGRKRKDGERHAARAYRRGFDFLSDEVVDVIAREAADQTSLLFKAIKPKGGEMPVVMGAGGSGILLHEAIGHTFEAVSTGRTFPYLPTS